MSDEGAGKTFPLCLGSLSSRAPQVAAQWTHRTVMGRWQNPHGEQEGLGMKSHRTGTRHLSCFFTRNRSELALCGPASHISPR